MMMVVVVVFVWSRWCVWVAVHLTGKFLGKKNFFSFFMSILLTFYLNIMCFVIDKIAPIKLFSNNHIGIIGIVDA